MLTAGATVLATEGPHDSVAEDGDRKWTLENLSPDDDVPVDSGQERTLDLMLMIWTLETRSSDTELNLEPHRSQKHAGINRKT